MLYKVEHQIFTLAHNAVMDDKESPASFLSEGIRFSDPNFNFTEGWQKEFWIATKEIESINGVEAINLFRRMLGSIVPKIALIGQSYIDFLQEPWLLKKKDANVVLFHLVRDRRGGGLMFMEAEKKALELLMDSGQVPEEFYKYWNDAVNAIGYSAKLLLMFSAVEALAKQPDGKDWGKINGILGKDLSVRIYGTPTESRKALRNRLVHGEYFSEDDIGENLVEMIHKKVLSYFNKEILKQDLLELQVVSPQRHPFGNKEQGFYWLKLKSKNISLKDVLKDFVDDLPQETENYEMVFDQMPDAY